MATQGSMLGGADANHVSRTFNGVVDEVAVFTRSLSRTKIAGLPIAAGGMVPATLDIQKESAQSTQ